MTSETMYSCGKQSDANPTHLTPLSIYLSKLLYFNYQHITLSKIFTK